MLKYQIIPVTDFEQNCSLLWCSETSKAALIDPGGDSHILLDTIHKHKLQLEQIWLTHGHLDHIGGTSDIQKQTQAKIIGPHEDDIFLIDSMQQQSQLFNFPVSENFKPDRFLNDEDKLTLGNESFEVLHTPGHTPGHIVIIHHASKKLWVGDVLFKGSIGRTDFPRGDFNTLIQSIKGKLFSLPADYEFIPGHGPNSTLGFEKQTNPFLK